MALTKLNNKAVANVTSIPVALGDMVLVSSATASASASIEFTLGNYKEYQFYFVNIHPSAADSNLQFQVSTDGTNFGIAKTSTFFRAYNDETGASYALQIQDAGGFQLAQSTSAQRITLNTGNDNDMCVNGYMKLFNPSSTTYVKHYISNTVNYEKSGAGYVENCYVGGYVNTTSALQKIKFTESGGNIDDGKILMFGIN